jgi:DNA-binding LytR/AlgR family response regulator
MSEEIAYNKIKPIVFKTPTGFVYFDYSDIIMCSADGNCTIIFTLESDAPFRVLHNISFIERKYGNDKFLRCHKSHIINLMHLEKLITKSHQVQLKKNFIVPLSENCWKIIRKMSEKDIS